MAPVFSVLSGWSRLCGSWDCELSDARHRAQLLLASRFRGLTHYSTHSKIVTHRERERAGGRGSDRGFAFYNEAPEAVAEKALLLIGAECWEEDATKQKSVKRSAFSLNGAQAFSECGMGKEFYRKGNSVKRFRPFSESPDSKHWNLLHSSHSQISAPS